MFDVNSLGSKLIDNQELKKLIEQGGGGSSGGGMLIINLTFNRNPSDASQWTATGDKTGAEIISAIESGKTIVLRGDFNGTQNIHTYIAYGYSYGTDSSVEDENTVSVLINYNHGTMFTARLDSAITGGTM